MAKHILSVEVLDTTNKGVFLIRDNSVYLSNLPINKPILEITYPGALSPTVINVLSGFNLVLNACTLGMLSSGSCIDCCPELPDGLYEITYSVSPNTKTLIQYYHLRTVTTLDNCYSMIADVKACDPDIETEYKFKIFNTLENFTKAAKYNAEILHFPDRALEMLKYTQKQLKKYIPGCKTC